MFSYPLDPVRYSDTVRLQFTDTRQTVQKNKGLRSEHYSYGYEVPFYFLLRSNTATRSIGTVIPCELSLVSG